MTVTRRMALSTIAGASAVVAAPVAAVVAAAPEAHVTKVNRLAHELSKAMAEWCADILPGMEPDVWKAHIYPHGFNDWPVSFEHIKGQTAEERVTAGWIAMCSALEEIMPMDGRLLIVGNHRTGQLPNFKVESVEERLETVRAGISIPVERSTAFVRFKDGGFQAMDM